VRHADLRNSRPVVTVEEMRAQVETEYQNALGVGVTLEETIPAGLTAMVWHQAIRGPAENIIEADFPALAETLGQDLATRGTGLALTHFARLTARVNKQRGITWIVFQAWGWNP